MKQNRGSYGSGKDFRKSRNQERGVDMQEKQKEPNLKPEAADGFDPSKVKDTCSALEGIELEAGYPDKVVIPALNVEIPEGKITTIIGPNGCGKSTLLKTLARIIPARGGTILLEGKKISQMPTRQIAAEMALLPQAPGTPAGLSVEELVSYGRYPHQKGFGRLSAKDHELIDKALKMTHMEDLRDRSVDTLSGGQRQRAWIAMALAQDTPVILLDEPTTYLDMAHQLEIMELLEKLNKEEGKTIALVIHDLNLAARFSDKMIAMKNGRIIKEGSAEEVMTESVMNDVFDLECLIMNDPWNGSPMMATYRVNRNKETESENREF